jgi:hypothetical protein|tara:strand:+ start:3242 stop:3673 length:432 start_codon:yes stop_codon:yes gene_type:complete
MFASYNLDNWPLVYIKLKGDIKSYVDYKQFTDTWLGLYNRLEPFTMLFDACEFGDVSIFYAIKMAMFIKKIKRKRPQYLQKSVIMLQSKWLKHLVGLMFFIEKPAAPVYVYYKDEHGDKPMNDLVDLVEKGEIDIFHRYLPSR